MANTEGERLSKAIAIISGDTAVILHNIEAADVLRTQKLLEKSYQINGLNSIRADVGHIPGCQRHLHLFRGRKEIGAFNQDGSSHDNSNFTIPTVHAKFIKTHFPNFVISSGRIVEANTLKNTTAIALLWNIANSTPFEILVIDLDKIEEDEKLANLIAELMDHFQGR